MKKILIFLFFSFSAIAQNANELKVIAESNFGKILPNVSTIYLLHGANDAGLWRIRPNDRLSPAGNNIKIHPSGIRFGRVAFSNLANVGIDFSQMVTYTAGDKRYAKLATESWQTPYQGFLPLFRDGGTLTKSVLFQSNGDLRNEGAWRSNLYTFKNLRGKVHATLDSIFLTLSVGPTKAKYTASGIEAIDTTYEDNAGGFGIAAKSFSVAVGGFAGLNIGEYQDGAYTKMGHAFSTSYAVVGQTEAAKHTRSRLQIGNQGAINRLELNASNNASKSVFLEDSAGVGMLGTAGNSKYRLLPDEIQESISGTIVRRTLLETDKVTELIGYQGGTERSQVALNLQGYCGEDDDEATLFSVDGDEDLMSVSARGNLKINPRTFFVGDVGVGNFAPAHKFDVTGGIRSTAGSYFATSSGNVVIGSNTDNTLAKFQTPNLSLSVDNWSVTSIDGYDRVYFQNGRASYWKAPTGHIWQVNNSINAMQISSSGKITALTIGGNGTDTTSHLSMTSFDPATGDQYAQGLIESTRSGATGDYYSDMNLKVNMDGDLGTLVRLDGKRGMVDFPFLYGVKITPISATQKSAITIPVRGQLIYCQDCTPTDGTTPNNSTTGGVFQVWNGSVWKNLW